MFVEVHDGELVDVEVEELDGAVAASHEQLALVDLGPGEVVLGVISVESAGRNLLVQWPKLGRGDGGPAHVFSMPTPFSVRLRQKRRPLPTMPKLADEATAMRES